MGKVQSTCFLFLSLTTAVWFGACGDKGGTLASIPAGEIQGTVVFLGQQRPDGDVVVQLWRDWPTSNAAVASQTIGNATGSQDFTLTDLPLGTFAAITVDWLNPLDPSNNRIIGVYWDNDNSVGADKSGITVSPKSVTLSADNPKVGGLKITADNSLID